MTTSPLRGLTAAELVQTLAALRQGLLRAEVVDVAGLRERDDLLVYLRTADATPRKLALHVAAGGTRGRVCPTERRFAKFDFALGPGAEVVRNQLLGAVLADAEAIDGERIAVLRWRKPDGAELRLVVELFGNRGLWLLLSEEDRILALSRLATSKDRTVALGERWSPPPRRAVDPPAEPESTTPRFASLTALDHAFTAADEAAEFAGLRDLCARAVERALAAARARCAGLEHQLAQGDEAARLRGRADLMLAYAHGVRRGAVSMRVPDPERDGEFLELPLAPDKPVVAQAQALYERARRLEDALGVAAARLAQAQAQLAELGELATRLDASATFAALTDLRDALVQRKLLRAASAPAARAKAGGAAERARPAAEAYRRFVSIEGYEILCGKTNEQNDRLSLRTARGNDLWLHIGRGHAGSHVVVKLPKGKTASLETLLDAATIAVHFSKARGAAKTEVIYTQAKHVRKPKGAPAGAVVPHQTKTLGVRLEEARLQRLLGASGES